MRFLGHEAVAIVYDPEKPLHDWMRCSCGGTFGHREFRPVLGHKKHREPHRIGPTFEEHVIEAEGLVRG